MGFGKAVASVHRVRTEVSTLTRIRPDLAVRACEFRAEGKCQMKNPAATNPPTLSTATLPGPLFNSTSAPVSFYLFFACVKDL